MKCPNCGAQIGSFKGDTYICDYCRSTYHRRELEPDWKPEPTEDTVKEIHHYHHQEAPDRLSAGMGCLCFLFFPIGWFIYFLNRESSPKKAKAALIIAVIMTVLLMIGIASGNGN
jgi:hypothetical protein